MILLEPGRVRRCTAATGISTQAWSSRDGRLSQAALCAVATRRGSQQLAHSRVRSADERSTVEHLTNRLRNVGDVFFIELKHDD